MIETLLHASAKYPVPNYDVTCDNDNLVDVDDSHLKPESDSSSELDLPNSHKTMLSTKCVDFQSRVDARANDKHPLDEVLIVTSQKDPSLIVIAYIQEHLHELAGYVDTVQSLNIILNDLRLAGGKMSLSLRSLIRYLKQYLKCTEFPLHCFHDGKVRHAIQFSNVIEAVALATVTSTQTPSKLEQFFDSKSHVAHVDGEVTWLCDFIKLFETIMGKDTFVIDLGVFTKHGFRLSTKLEKMCKSCKQPSRSGCCSEYCTSNRIEKKVIYGMQLATNTGSIVVAKSQLNVFLDMENTTRKCVIDHVEGHVTWVSDLKVAFDEAFFPITQPFVIEYNTLAKWGFEVSSTAIDVCRSCKLQAKSQGGKCCEAYNNLSNRTKRVVIHNMRLLQDPTTGTE